VWLTRWDWDDGMRELNNVRVEEDGLVLILILPDAHFDFVRQL